ncbi:hypothetical protein T492DRAFT_360501 [Pavlovales sp. CCMP2436]|nr:hypothetical protein T492DRAFT_360501 [Pavlovales sp. CCMP2436]
MPPKQAQAKGASERPLLPRIGDRETNRLAPVFDLAEVKALLAGDAKAGGEPYADPDFDGGSLRLPAALEAVTHEWRRPRQLAGVEGAAPYVVEPAIDPANLRALANGLRAPAPLASSEATQLLEWVTSSMQLVAEHAAAVAEGDFLWQLVHPQSEAGMPQLSEKGRYVVRLFDHGRWRAFTVDDKLPCDVEGRCLLPHTRAPAELWPLLLTKALLKLGARSSAGLRARDPTVVTALTGWLPQVLPIAPASQPRHLVWDALCRALAAEGTVAALTAAEPSAEDEPRKAELAAAGVRAGPLVPVVEARSAAGGNYARFTSELLRWSGRLCDTDEAHWSSELDAELGWKRRQRLRKVAAGARLLDFWTDEAAMLDSFAELIVWRDPAVGWVAQRLFAGITHVPAHCECLLRVGSAGIVSLAAEPAPATPATPAAPSCAASTASALPVPAAPAAPALLVGAADEQRGRRSWRRL